MGPQLTRQGLDTDDEEDDEALVAGRGDESRTAGSGSSKPEPSLKEDLFGYEFLSDDESQQTPSPQKPRERQ